MSAPSAKSGSVVGVRVDIVTMQSVVDTVMGWAEARTPPRTAVGVNAYVCNMAATNKRFASLLSSTDLSYADGQSVVWAARLLKVPLPQRVATTDLIEPLMAACAAAGRAVFFFGGRPGVAELAAQKMVSRHPQLRIRTQHGYVPDSGMGETLKSIADHDTDLLFVGLGDPHQQEWIDAHRNSLSTPAILTCGGLFDWISGQNKRAPQWMIRTGLEWLWRLMIEPRRLARRYLLGNPAFIARLLSQLVRSALRKR